MRFRLLGTFALPALVCTSALWVAPVAAVSAPDAKAAVKAVAKTPAVTAKAPLPISEGSVGARATSIMGVAWNADNTPIPGAKLRLRNVLSGRIVATVVANGLGQFAFNDVESGSYVIELVSDDGKILAVGHTFTVAPGETVATFVRLAAKAPWFSGFFGNSASAIASAAAAAGVTAVAPEEMACASPPCSR
jgi:hypothetical protein